MLPGSVILICFSIQTAVLAHVSHPRSHLLHAQEPPKDVSTSCKKKSVCVPFVQCPAHVLMNSKTECKTLKGHQGVCCSTGQNHTSLLNEKLRHHHSLRMDPLTMGLVARHSHAEIVDLKLKESVLLAEGHMAVLIPGSASYGHFRNFMLPNKVEVAEVADLASRALEIALATRDFKNRQGLSNQMIELGLLRQDLRPTPLGIMCPARPLCPLYLERHRRIEGVCNNLANPSWGAGMTPYARLLPPSYQDGVWEPRLSVTGHPLRSPRLISTAIFSDKDVFNYDYTLMVMQFGQFLSHDLTQSIENSYANGSAISCCSVDGSSRLNPQELHYACMSIDIPQDDPFYHHFNQRCMNFVRSILAPRHDCTLGYAQQMNKITHFLDGSGIYGSTPGQTSELRSFQKGMLKVFDDFGRPLLPLAKDPDSCVSVESGSACFMSGDTRTNQMISLVALHTVFVREHNRIAEVLSKINPFWGDERIFLEARRIVVAELQVIVFKEFLPVIIGDVAMKEFQLTLAKDGYYSNDYDERVEPSITNEFASAVWRFGHSTIDGVLKIYGKDRMDEMISIPEVMFQPGRMRKAQFFDELLSTLTTEPMQEVDNNLAEALTRYMFRAGNPFGVDLASLNIQRGRDHGLRPYNDYRQLVGLPKIQDFAEFGYEMGQKLSHVYSSVDDVDLWVGGLLEDKVPGSILGFTFREIIADQFYRLKKGDRYFFENDPSINPGFFTLDQLVELRKASMSRLICDNSDGILLARQAPNAFKTPGTAENEFVDCANFNVIPTIDLMYWQE